MRPPTPRGSVSRRFTVRRSLPCRAVLVLLATAGCVAAPAAGAGPSPAPAASTAAALVVRTNQIGYLPDGPKVAVACALDATRITGFVVRDEAGRDVLGPRAATAA